MPETNITRWWNSLSPAQQEAHKSKMAEGRRRRAAARRTEAKQPEATIPTTAIPPTLTDDPAYHETFRSLLREFLQATAGRDGNFNFTDRWCRLCIASGIHNDFTPGGCDCPCHRARVALAAYDDARANARGN